jgi:hypothetical protein
MPDLDDAALELRLREVLKEHLGALPLDITVETLDRRRQARGAARRSGRGRGMTLLAAAATVAVVGGALAAGSGVLRPRPAVVPPVTAPSLAAVSTASPDATSPRPSGSATPSAGPIPVAGPGGAWIPTGTMVTPRGGKAVRLLDGRVLVVGGSNDAGHNLTSAELYDPATGTWSATGTLTAPGKKVGFGVDTATLLSDGRVLITGDSTELYDPATGTWTATAKPIGELGSQGTATLLRDGKVLVTWFSSSQGGTAQMGTAQLYDPASGIWHAAGKMITPRLVPTATLLSDGRVLVAGGQVCCYPDDWTKAAEIFDPVTGSWTKIADMHSPNPGTSSSIATQLPDGKVQVYSVSGLEVYDPTTGVWTAGPKPTKVLPHPWALLSDGTVLTDDPDHQKATDPGTICAAAVFDPRTGSFTTTPPMLRCGAGSSFTPLLDGTVLAAGGIACKQDGSGECVSTSAAELYVPAGVSLPPLPAFPTPPPFAFPSPTPVPTPLPPADGPVPPNARSWTVTVDNQSSQPATMWVVDGTEGELVGSATPNVVPAGATMRVTFLFPRQGGWIDANLRPGEGGGLLTPDQIGIPGKMVITAEGDTHWVGPAQ